MASSTTGKQFRRTLLRVSEVLTKKNVHDLAFLCEAIPPARREELKDALDLFGAFQGHDLLGENNVNTLIEWLEELRLLEASKPLKDYRSQHLKPVVAPSVMCLIHEDVPLKYFCVTCKVKLCPDCAFTSHGKEKGCDVVRLNTIEDEIITRRAKLTEELENTTMQAKSTRQLWEEKKTFISKCGVTAQKEAHEDYLELLEQVTQKMRIIAIDLGKKWSTDMTNLLEEDESIQILESRLERLKMLNKGSSDYSLVELQKIQKATDGVNGVKRKLEEQTELAKKREIDITYRRVNNDGAFGVISVGTLVGAVSIKPQQLVKILDERHSTGEVLLVCMDPEDPHKEYWRHSKKIDDHRSPVVCSSVDMFYEGQLHVLIAIGKIVYIVHTHWNGKINDYVEMIEPMVIDEVPKGSWITNITVKSIPDGRDKKEFMVALFRSSVIKQYNLSGELVRSIDARGHVFSSGISGLACSNTALAVLSRGNDDVILLSVAEETVKQCGCLKPQSAGFIPTFLIWTGARWLVLSTTPGKVKKWKVVMYYEQGEIAKECLEGTCPDEFDVPGSLARSLNTGYVISASRIRVFQY